MAINSNIYDSEGALLKQGVGNFEMGFIGEHYSPLSVRRIKNGYLTSSPMQGETAHLTIEELCVYIREYFEGKKEGK